MATKINDKGLYVVTITYKIQLTTYCTSEVVEPAVINDWGGYRLYPEISYLHIIRKPKITWSKFKLFILKGLESVSIADLLLYMINIIIALKKNERYKILGNFLRVSIQ